MIWAPQNTEHGRLLRSLPRGVWRELFRASRITAREARKAFDDMRFFGTGFVRYTGDERVCERVDPASIWRTQ